MRVLRMAAYGLVVMVVGSGFVARAQQIAVGKDNRTIAITTTDSVDQVADQADVSVGFETYGNDEDSTYADGSRLSSAITKALTDAGVKAEDISSQQQNPGADQRYGQGALGEGHMRFPGWTQSWTVTTAAKNAANVLGMWRLWPGRTTAATLRGS